MVRFAPLASLLVLTLLGPPAFAQDPAALPAVELVRVEGVDRADVLAFVRQGLDVASVRGGDAELYVTAGQLEALRAAGRTVSVLPRPGGVADVLAGYPSLAELAADLADVAAAHPDLCRLESIGTSVQGRPLWFMEISADPDLEQDEPEVKLVSSMHGNEPVGMVMCLDLIHLLTEQYGIDPQVTALVDECELWIMPLMNPDGYALQSRYNAQGVDLNRDFPDRVDDPVNTVAGRAPETQAMMTWEFGHSPVLAANFHTGALVANYPYDSDPNPFASYSASPDDGLMIELALTYAGLNPPMSASGSFPQGITNGVAWYPVYGGMQDWSYVWQGCNELTVELSNSYWPSASALPGLWDDNREAMLAYAERSLRGVRGLVTDAVGGQPVAARVTVLGIDHSVYADPDVGDYHRLLLPGTYTLRVAAEGYALQSVPGVAVGSGDATRVDVALVPDGFTDLGQGLAGTGGVVPALAGSGALTGGSLVGFHLADALPGTTTNLVLGVAAIDAPFKGGILVPSPDLLLPGLPVDSAGALDVLFPFPAGLPSGASLFLQHWVADPAAPKGFAASNGLQLTTP